MEVKLVSKMADCHIQWEPMALTMHHMQPCAEWLQRHVALEDEVRRACERDVVKSVAALFKPD